MSTQTDNLIIQIIDTQKFNNLTIIEQEFIEKCKKSLLEIFPINNNTVDDKSSELAENFAFKNLEAMNVLIDNKINEAIDNL